MKEEIPICGSKMPLWITLLPQQRCDTELGEKTCSVLSCHFGYVGSSLWLSKWFYLATYLYKTHYVLVVVLPIN